MKIWNKLSLVQRILVCTILGIVLALFVPEIPGLSLCGKLFVNALKSLAPILVLFLVMSSLAKHKNTGESKIKDVIFLYIVGMLLAGGLAVAVGLSVDIPLVLNSANTNADQVPGNIGEVIQNIVLSMFTNPIQSAISGNYMSILFWAVVFGLAAQDVCDKNTLDGLESVSKILTKAIEYIISCAPFGVMGLIYATVLEGGLESLFVYGRIILILVAVMSAVALIINPLIVFVKLRRNPYPLVFQCLRESGITAFFTRSSAANIPINIALCERLKLDKATYSVSIPLGATINMEGASVTISILTLAAVQTVGISVDAPTALVLCIISAVSACGASGVAGGSLLLIPLACNLFGINQDISMQVVAIGFMISVVQDSFETALNSSTDALFTAACDLAKHRNS